MQIKYSCFDCRKAFFIEITDEEKKRSLSEAHSEACPQCGRRVGTGSVSCQSCGNQFVLEFLHWHVTCDVARGNCPSCGQEYDSWCIC